MPASQFKATGIKQGDMTLFDPKNPGVAYQVDTFTRTDGKEQFVFKTFVKSGDKWIEKPVKQSEVK